MEYDLPVAQMARGDDIEGFYVLKSAFSKVANNGKPFLNLTLSDRTGAVDAKVWDYPGPIGAADEGKVVKIRGSVSEFRGALQVTVERIRLAGEDDRYDVTALVPTAPIDGEAMYASVEALLDSITDADYKAVCRELLRRHSESFRTIPAAKSVHHGFLHGLLMHTGNMMQLADFLAGMYADTVDRSAAFTPSVQFLPLQETAWVNALEKADFTRNPNALAETRAAGYDIIDSAKKLQEFYLRKDKEAAHAN